MPIRAVWRARWVVRDGQRREVLARRGEVSRGRTARRAGRVACWC